MSLEAEVVRLRQELEDAYAVQTRLSEELLNRGVVVERLREALQEGETLLTNYLVAGKFPPGSDCEAVRERSAFPAILAAAGIGLMVWLVLVAIAIILGRLI